jgi:DNA primase
MGKISPVSAKYIIHATIQIGGIVDKPDVIGAIFGQTEGLLGADLELRELQRSGRIGRIEVNVETRTGKSQGQIIIPSSLDKAETAIVGAALEIIQRIGPCNAKIKVEKIEDVRVSKRAFVIERAKELLKNLMDTSIPDSQELADEVAYSVRVMEIQEYGKDRLPAGPSIDESDEIIIVEGRADVINLLKHGFKNGIAINGTSIPPSIAELCSKKIVTVFVDGDRGGNLILKEILGIADIDYVTRAPDGKELEEITKKEIHKALRSRISAEQVKLELGVTGQYQGDGEQKPQQMQQQRAEARENQQLRAEAKEYQQQRPAQRPVQRPEGSPQQRDLQQRDQSQRPSYQDKKQQPASAAVQQQRLTAEEKKEFSGMLEDLIGTRGAYVLDTKLNILGKVPLAELTTTVGSLGSGVYAVVFDGTVEKDLVDVADKAGVKFVVGMDSKVKSGSKCMIITTENL